MPPPGDSISEVALVEDHVSIAGWPACITVGFACKVTVGRAAGPAVGGGDGSGCVATGSRLHPLTTASSSTRLGRMKLATDRFGISNSSLSASKPDSLN